MMNSTNFVRILVLCTTSFQFAIAQVGIGTTTPHPSSILELSSTTAGILIPRLTEAQKNIINAPATSLLIYQIDGASGYYYYNGTAWTCLLCKNWSLTGNASTVDGTNFMGTTDNVPFSIKVNNQKAGRIDHLLFNSFFGYQAGNNNTTGTKVTATGFQAGLTNTTGSQNTFLGYGADATSTNLTNATAIGYNAKVSANNSLTLGGTGADAVKVGIGTSSPLTSMHVKTTTGATGLLLETESDGTSFMRFVEDPSISGGGVAFKYDGAGLPAVNNLKILDNSTSNVLMTIIRGGGVGIATASVATDCALDSKGSIALSNGGTASALRFYEPSANGSNYTGFVSQAQTADVTYTLPAADGTNGQQLTTNGAGTLSWTPASSAASKNTSQKVVANPGTTNNTSVTMLGLSGSITLASSTKMMIIISGDGSTSGNDGKATCQIYYGTGAAPSNGAGVTGTATGNFTTIDIVGTGSAQRYPFTCNTIVSGLTAGQTYWIDLGSTNTGGNTFTPSNVSISVVEL